MPASLVEGPSRGYTALKHYMAPIGPTEDVGFRALGLRAVHVFVFGLWLLGCWVSGSVLTPQGWDVTFSGFQRRDGGPNDLGLDGFRCLGGRRVAPCRV